MSPLSFFAIFALDLLVGAWAAGNETHLTIVTATISPSSVVHSASVLSSLPGTASIASSSLSTPTNSSTASIASSSLSTPTPSSPIMSSSSEQTSLPSGNSSIPFLESSSALVHSSAEESSSDWVSSSSMPEHESSEIQPATASKQIPSSSAKTEKVIVIKCGEECKALKRRLWAAGVFAALFGFTTLVFLFLLFRQCRISRDYNDPALSRLI